KTRARRHVFAHWGISTNFHQGSSTTVRSAVTKQCITSGSGRVDQRLGVNQFEPIPGLNLWDDSSVSLQLSESCPPSQHFLFGSSRPPRWVKLTTLSHTQDF
ncbi:hypothetical protein XENORESO_017315, partial [Xenotaenia resolanae]